MCERLCEYFTCEMRARYHSNIDERARFEWALAVNGNRRVPPKGDMGSSYQRPAPLNISPGRRPQPPAGPSERGDLRRPMTSRAVYRERKKGPLDRTKEKRKLKKEKRRYEAIMERKN